MSKIKGLDLEDKQMRFFPVQQGIMEVKVSTKKKQGYIKLALPDQMISDLMNLSLGAEDKVVYEQYIISCRKKDTQ